MSERPTSEEAASPQSVFSVVSPERVSAVVDLLKLGHFTTVLVGEFGSGKSYLAQAAISALNAEADTPFDRILIHTFDDMRAQVPHQIKPAESPQLPRHEAERIELALADEYDLSTLIIVALGIHDYPDHDAAVLETLVRRGKLRFICTARELSGAADRLARNPDVHQYGVSPYSQMEAEAFLANILGVDQIAPSTLDRWYAATEGNPHALMTLALSAERRGKVHRGDRVAWVNFRDDAAPAEFVSQLGELTPLELATLELTAYAAPVHEPALFKLFDADSVSELLKRQVLRVRTDPYGASVLTTRLPVIAEAIRSQISPVRRARLGELCFDALNAETKSTTRIDPGKLRMVRFGVEGGRELPIDWVWIAMREAARTGDYNFALHLALTAMSNEDPHRSADAVLRACEFGHITGNSEALDQAVAKLESLLADQTLLEQLADSTVLELHLTSVFLEAGYQGNRQGALAALDQAVERVGNRAVAPEPTFEIHRARIHAMFGAPRQALKTLNTLHTSFDLETVFITLPAQVYGSFVHTQAGRFRQALDIAQTANQLTLLHDVSPAASGGIETFAVFLAHWARGTTHSARRVLSNIPGKERLDVIAAHSSSGFIDLSILLYAIQDGRMTDASLLGARLANVLSQHDPFGALPLVQAATALAHAVLGAHDTAQQYLEASARERPGVSLALKGVVGVLSLRARHWLRDPNLLEQAFELASWARLEHLALIELEAYDIAAHEIDGPDPLLLKRAHLLTRRIDAPIGDALLAHLHVLTHRPSGIVPEERLLSELGVWLPLPPAPTLTGREREIALFTALGYPSKQVAERLHLSARTVETHLAHVYSKLGINDREALRHWFARQRESHR